MNLKAVGFDYKGVIAGDPAAVFDQRVSDILDLEVNDYKNIYQGIYDKINKKEVSYDEFWYLILQQSSRVEKRSDLLTFLETQKNQGIQKNIVDLIDSIRATEYKTALLSNNSKKKAEELRRIGLDKHFDVFEISDETGLEKPAEESYKHLASSLKISLKELIFIDDTESNLAPSKNLGFTPILYKNYKKLVEELGKYIDF
jgi:epoxide hydrolase-like predicted phosphatase